MTPKGPEEGALIGALAGFDPVGAGSDRGQAGDPL